MIADRQRKPNWAVMIRTAITLSVLGYLGLKLHWAELGALLMQSEPFWLLIAFSLIGTGFILGGMRWWLLLKVQEISVPLKTATSLTFIGQFFNAFLLGTTGGDVIKIFYILKYAPDQKARAALSIVMDRVLGLFVLLCCALAALPWQLPSFLSREETKTIIYALFVLFGLFVGSAMLLAFIPFQSLPALFHRLWRKVPKRNILESLMFGFRQHGQAKCLTFEAMLLNIAICFLTFTAGYCIALAIHLPVSFVQILTILSVVTCIISLPISIGGHGIREGMFVIMFAAFSVVPADPQGGMGQEPAVLFSILFFALFSGWSIVGGLVYLSFGAPSRKGPEVLSTVPISGDTEKLIDM